MEAGSPIGYLLPCPVCYQTVNPLYVTHYESFRHIPSRVVVKCPSDRCQGKTIWYVPLYKIEEAPRADAG